MFYTRCPECDTTFRITEAALQQAEGQVRCGRCAHIFNAHEFLSRRLEEDDATAVSPGSAVGSGPAAAGAVSSEAESAAEIDAPDEDAEAAPADVEDAPQAEAPAEQAPPDADAPISEDADHPSGENSAALPPEDAAPVMNSTDIAAVLEATVPPVTPAWLGYTAASPPGRSWLWSAAAGLAVIALGAQAVHYYRSDLVRHELAAAPVERVYSWFGQTITPNWNVEEYELLDWVAVADPAQSGHGNLIIRSQLQNAGDREQPYPLVYLRLLDRWEDTVAARLFRPDEYLRGARSGGMMRPGATADAELVIVDPGADAYGFELAVCIETGQHVECDSDETFRN